MKAFKLLGVTIAASGLLLVGCHTVRGIGQDVEAGGKVIVKTTEKTHKDIKEALKRDRGHKHGYTHKNSHGHTYYYKNGKRVYVRHSHPHAHKAN